LPFLASDRQRGVEAGTRPPIDTETSCCVVFIALRNDGDDQFATLGITSERMRVTDVRQQAQQVRIVLHLDRKV
jgi:hypothetical protein